MFMSFNCSYLYLHTGKEDDSLGHCLHKADQQSGLLTYLGQSQEGLIFYSHKTPFFPFPSLYSKYKFNCLLMN